MKRTAAFIFAISVLASFTAGALPSSDLQKSFAHPPASARPWVYWFWLNGNITREGITADLEAMKRVGIGGVLIMEVDQGAPVGPVDFMGAKWRELFQHVVHEAKRLGLEVNMNDDAGWNGSGGPWIKPEQSMQQVVWSETAVEGPSHVDQTLTQPRTIAGYYRDITVLAFPTPSAYRIPGIQGKALYDRSFGSPLPASYPAIPADAIIPHDRIVDISAKMDSSGRLTWDAPAGTWTILRIGHTGTGAENAPAPASGRGLECDKLSKEGSEAAFGGMMRKLADENMASGSRPAAGLVATHIDSWENGMQNWTARMREEFGARRGYDMSPFLPVMTGRVVDSLEISERFLWDLRQTINELCVDYYAGHMRELAQSRGLRLSIEAYNGPCDDMTFAGRADEPMCEFWMGGGAFETVKEMASAAHTYGKRILGAESFTAGDQERWQEHPGSIKSLGDRAFCDGVNRFVFHRYAMQPWTKYAPGMTMGPWGLHYERTATWWELTGPWHEYLARCQHMLRQGLYVADILYLQPEVAPQGGQYHDRNGYDFDNISAEALVQRASVRDGRIVLPDGMSYRILALPSAETMTPALLRRIQALVSAGATVVGLPPRKSPSLSGYPACDRVVRQLAADVWGNCDGKSVKEHRYGRGRIVCGLKPEQVLAKSGVPADFNGGSAISWIHRKAGEEDIYFVASNSTRPRESVCSFRMAGKRPELWNPETGKVMAAPAYHESGGLVRIPLRFDPSGSVFVVFRSPARTAKLRSADPLVRLARNGRDLWKSGQETPGIVISSAKWGPAGDEKRTKDVTDQVRRMVRAGACSFNVAALALEGDPALNVVKTLNVDYSVGNNRLKASARDPETISFEVPAEPVPPIRIEPLPGNGFRVEANAPGRYEVSTRSGKRMAFHISTISSPIVLGGRWRVGFPAGSGAPKSVELARLATLSEHENPSVRFFSGTAVYINTFMVPATLLSKNRRVYLDLGNVQVMAQVNLNGRELGTLWKPPYQLDVTSALRPGPNLLQVRVTNTWVNRLIGDEQLPEDSLRNSDGTLKEWPAWVAEGKPSPTGRHAFTSWRLWKKGEKPAPSGLIGPVVLREAEVISVR